MEKPVTRYLKVSFAVFRDCVHVTFIDDLQQLRLQRRGKFVSDGRLNRPRGRAQKIRHEFRRHVRMDVGLDVTQRKRDLSTS